MPEMGRAGSSAGTWRGLRVIDHIRIVPGRAKTITDVFVAAV
jgi:hypothetical protein